MAETRNSWRRKVVEARRHLLCAPECPKTGSLAEQFVAKYLTTSDMLRLRCGGFTTDFRSRNALYPLTKK